MAVTPVQKTSGMNSFRLLGLVALIALGVIATAWAYEILGGLKPCPLCLTQRWAYYFSIPAIALILLAFHDLRQGPGALLLTFVTLAFAANAVLAAYHSGVEWHWWMGPTACTGGGEAADLQTAAGGLLESIESTRVVRCDEASWRFLGLSFAGWNVIISLVLAAACLRVLMREFRTND
ncbi:MAG: disulfide bond formation protein B [Hyphomicrobiaceae bacterium]